MAQSSEHGSIVCWRLPDVAQSSAESYWMRLNVVLAIAGCGSFFGWRWLKVAQYSALGC